VTLLEGRADWIYFEQHLARHATEMADSTVTYMGSAADLIACYDQEMWARFTGPWQRVFTYDGDDGEIVAHCVLTGMGGITGHRCRLGLAVEGAYRRKGVGRALMREALSWACDQPSLEWVDGEAVSENTAVLSLDFSEGFRVSGLVLDAARVNGRSVNVTLLALNLGERRSL